MVFSSNLFVFGFIPVFFSLYYLLPKSCKNIFILTSSLLFYEFGAGHAVEVLLASIVMNYYAGIMIELASNSAIKTITLASAITLNLAALFYYKYTPFAWDVANSISNNGMINHHVLRPDIALPIGISFFTFQAISYVTDIYSGHCKAARNLFNFGMYHSLFPQLIAGPIVRYSEIESMIVKRSLSVAIINNGLYRFAIGLAKKVIIADHVGAIANTLFNLPIDNLSPALAWFGAASYTLQIYFDFSGYSDMAIGLGMMLGFTFPENFNRPYRAQNITDFWRRWHMTLSRWFRDYVYIPLGGNRKNIYRTYFNLFIVFFICGLWHGAGYTFLVWGLFQGLLLMIERYASHQWNIIPKGIAGQCYTLLMLMIGWVFFRSDSLTEAFHYLGKMFYFFRQQPNAPNFHDIASIDQTFFFIVGIILAIIPFKYSIPIKNSMTLFLRYTASLMLFILSMATLAVHTFNPFLYFRF